MLKGQDHRGLSALDTQAIIEYLVLSVCLDTLGVIGPPLSDIQFSCQPWYGQDPINHGDLPMQKTDLTMILSQFVNGANCDGSSADCVKTLGSELFGNPPVWLTRQPESSAPCNGLHLFVDGSEGSLAPQKSAH